MDHILNLASSVNYVFEKFESLKRNNIPSLMCFKDLAEASRIFNEHKTMIVLNRRSKDGNNVNKSVLTIVALLKQSLSYKQEMRSINHVYDSNKERGVEWKLKMKKILFIRFENFI